MKKFVAMVLMVVLMMALAAPALADNVEFNFSVYGTESAGDVSSFGVKEGTTGTPARVQVLSLSGANSTYKLYIKLRNAYNTASVSSEKNTYSTGTKYVDYHEGKGVQREGYCVKVYTKSTSSPIISGQINFIP